MKLRRMYRRCEALLRDLDIPNPFDVRVLCERVAEDRGRPIHLEAVSLPADGPCGLWISTSATDYIFFEERTSPFHQEHIIAHELGHLLCDHGKPAAQNANALHGMLSALDPQMIGRVLHRKHYAQAEEQEAEIFASLILQRVSRRPSEPVRRVPSDAAGVVDRLDRSLRHQPADPDR
ncbi:ImmA/IrrE family metallo-endopeptidase [Streptomyces sp. NPDC019890]|uniref:ImmA/IrrE family metallo-endopeptidase n=1 Tax=Streptomyces sp. NPDC019890 TaxID=3365064 RepID=UPI00385172C4